MTEFIPAAARARIAQLDLEIQSLQDSDLLDGLLIEREQAHRALADYKYPILSLPTEITSEIFVHFLPAYPQRPELVGLLSPSLFLQVCRHWRDVALATPALWSTMMLQVVGGSNFYSEEHDLLDTWLQRSGHCPLSISFECTQQTPLIAASVESILRHASRLQDMYLCLPFENLKQFATVSMPILHRLTVGPTAFSFTFGHPDPAEASEIFMQAPNLQAVTLSGCFNPFQTPLPWAQITSLTADALFPGEAIEIFQHTTALVKCTMTFYHDDDEPVAIRQLPPLPVRSMRLLWKDDVPRSSTVELFKVLNLPELECLRVSEVVLGRDPIDSLTALRRNGRLKLVEIVDVKQVSREVYNTAFPDVKVFLNDEYYPEDSQMDSE
ncbi:hypothetical protein FB45DRAFT_914341 [Roridomyces roridus]|uniref:F-box domain-containing protein n=1 Tax=Roridomyces roridus TaxID=1738132 RepID=A0AAD7BXD1_9AGAR|nr:hypothetical protein FB45DRAFT_914341 [Roridomyces roridus]